MNSLLIKSSEKGVKFHRSQVHKAVRNPSQRNVYKWLSNNAYVKINVHVLTANLNLQLNYYLSKILNTLIKILLIILNSRSFGKLFVQIAAASFTERIVESVSRWVNTLAVPTGGFVAISNQLPF